MWCQCPNTGAGCLCKMLGNQLPYGPTPSTYAVSTLNVHESSEPVTTSDTELKLPFLLDLSLVYTCDQVYLLDKRFFRKVFFIRKANSKQGYILLFIFLLFIA